MKRVYFVRHALSTSNEKRVVEQEDHLVELSEKGHKQALTVGERFRTIPIDIIISSTYKRAIQTAQGIQKVANREIVTTDLLKERKHPSVFEGKPIDEPSILETRRELLRNAHDKNWRHSDEENYWDQIERAQKAIDFIQSRSEERLAVVTHSAFLKAVLTVMMFGEESKPEHFEAMYHFMIPKNTGITICEYTAYHGMIRTEPQWRLMTFNDYVHLGE